MAITVDDLPAYPSGSLLRDAAGLDAPLGRSSRPFDAHRDLNTASLDDIQADADDYLRYLDEVFAYFEDVSRRVSGREIPQILLLAVNSLNADRFDRLADAPAASWVTAE